MTISRREFLASMGGLAALLMHDDALAAPAANTRYGLVGTILTGHGSPPLVDHGVLINKGRIEDVVPAHAIADREILALPDAFILPGIVNCHVHRIHSATDRRERYLKHGVTSIGDAASPMAALSELMVSPPGRTATAACAGPMLCPPGGYPLPVHSPDHGLVASSPAQGRERVRQLADVGATMVKLAFEPGPHSVPWPVFNVVTAEAICDEARKRNLTVRCHVEDVGGLKPALDAGVHTIEHVPHRWIDSGQFHKILKNTADMPVPTKPYRDLLDRMVRESVILTPTLDVLSRSIWNGPELFEPVRYFARAGGQIALGNDHPYRRTDAGMPLQEMRLLRKAGLEPDAIITSATNISARACGFTDRGTIAPGMAADMLVLTKDPRESLEAFTTPLHIIKDGVFIT
ncbi:amidohydrolase family protein [Pseudodesulfovibrio sp.]|nr:amidohydrolase family protein [Pseudodesulfovibrio sp.]